jgi:hypothetical protein
MGSLYILTLLNSNRLEKMKKEFIIETPKEEIKPISNNPFDDFE